MRARWCWVSSRNKALHWASKKSGREEAANGTCRSFQRENARILALCGFFGNTCPHFSRIRGAERLLGPAGCRRGPRGAGGGGEWWAGGEASGGRGGEAGASPSPLGQPAPARLASTASESAGQASLAHGPNGSVESPASAIPASGSAHTNEPDWPKWP